MPKVAADLGTFDTGVVGEPYGIDAGDDLPAVVEREIRREHRIESRVHLFVVGTCGYQNQTCDA